MYVLNEFYCMEKGGWGEDGAGAWNEGVGGSVWIPAVSYVLGRCGVWTDVWLHNYKCLVAKVYHDFSVSKAFELWFI